MLLQKYKRTDGHRAPYFINYVPYIKGIILKYEFYCTLKLTLTVLNMCVYFHSSQLIWYYINQLETLSDKMHSYPVIQSSSIVWAFNGAVVVFRSPVSFCV